MPEQTSLNLDDLLRVLHAATDKQRLQWTKTADEYTFRTQVALGLVRIARLGNDPPRYSLALVDQDGVLLDEFLPSGEGTLLAIEALYKKARRSALNLETELRVFYGDLAARADES